MFRAWRKATVVAFAGAAALAAQLTAVAPAQAAGPTITIAASSKFVAVTHDVFVIYDYGPYSKATIHGTISGATAGDVATLFAQEFPFKTAPVKLGSITLKAATTSYSFTVAPNLYTKYAVRVFSGTQRLATTGVQAVYTLPRESATGGSTCGRPTCHETFHLYTIIPSSAFRTEAVKHLYPYFGLNLSTSGEPNPPNWLYLNGGHAVVSKPRRISGAEFEITLSYSFTIGNDGYYWLWNACLKDTVGADGLGLPGSHGCGATRISKTVYYLG
jgi:hypothetical protein